MFKYPGNKSKIASKICDRLELQPSEIYYEPFLGSGAVLLEILKSNPEQFCYAYDASQAVLDFWRSLQCDPIDLAEKSYEMGQDS